MDMASCDDWNTKGRPAPRRATPSAYSVAADFSDADAMIESEAELIDRLIGGLVAELFSGDVD